MAAVAELELSIAEAPSAVEISSDAAKSGTATPGLAGHCHGATWAIRLRDDDPAFGLAERVVRAAQPPLDASRLRPHSGGL